MKISGLKKILCNFADLVKVATFVTFGLVGTYIVLILTNKQVPEHLIDFVKTVTTLYFGTQLHQKITRGENQDG